MPLLSQSQEDYLEAIHLLRVLAPSVCVRDISAKLNVSMPSVVGALRRLEKLGLARHGRYDYVELTTKGRRMAKGVVKRHALLKRFLTDVLGVNDGVAEADACAIEHSLSKATADAFVNFFRHLDEIPSRGRDLMDLLKRK